MDRGLGSFIMGFFLLHQFLYGLALEIQLSLSTVTKRSCTIYSVWEDDVFRAKTNQSPSPTSQTKSNKPSNSNKPLRALTQLAYVLPPPLHEKLLPFHVYDTLQKKYAHCFPQSYDDQGRPKLEFQWAFCRYFWESHVEFPEIPIDTIQSWESEF